jgi:uroporphyrin-3 C-methyltransferase
MSESKNDIQATDDAKFEAVDDVVIDEPAEDRKPGRGTGVAWLAVILSALALAAVGYTVVGDWLASDDAGDAETLARIGELDQQLATANAAIAALEAESGPVTHPDFAADIEAVRREVDEQIRLLNSLPSRMAAVEGSVASLAGISAGARETFLLAEAEYYLQIANAQLQLANNPKLSSLALSMADERVTQLSDPGLTVVRRAISDELAALEVMEKPDLEGATLTLASLARVVESLPLASRKVAADAAAEADADQGNVGRAWDSVKGAMSGLVKVTPPDQAKLALVSPDAEYFLRNNIALQLQSARLALLRGEQTIFEQTLDDASALLNTWFDADSEQVASAQLTIAEIRADVFTTNAPDISESLRLLRQFRTLRENAE